MIIGERLRQLREKKGFSQGDIEERTGLLRCYISRVENGHTVPSLETLERFAGALDIPLHEIFYAGEELPATATPNLTSRKSLEEVAEVGQPGPEDGFLLKFKDLINRIADCDRKVLLVVARRMATTR
jgi:transcriptional regulator with XRE-family HTH domain